MSDIDAKDDWVRRVLGVDIPRSSGPAIKMLPVWQDARDLVGEQINKLEAAMRASGLSLFARIADRGLNGFTQTRLVDLQVALMEFDGAQGEARQKAAAKVRSAAQSMRGFLDSAAIPRLLDENRLRVPVTVRSTLSAALDRIETSMSA